MQYIYIIAKLSKYSARSNKLLFNYFLTSMAQIEGFSYISQVTIYRILHNENYIRYNLHRLHLFVIVYPPVNRYIQKVDKDNCTNLLKFFEF